MNLEPKRKELPETKDNKTEEPKIEVSFELDTNEEELLEEFGVLYQVEYPNAI